MKRDVDKSRREEEEKIVTCKTAAELVVKKNPKLESRIKDGTKHQIPKGQEGFTS